MNHEDSTATSWYPGDISPDNFRKLGYRVIDMIAEHFEGLPEARVFPPRNSTQIEEIIREPLPETGQDPDAILDDWTERVLPNVTQVGSPRYFGFVNGSGSMMAVLAEALSVSVNQNVGAWKPGPAATEIERRTISWLAELIGFEPECGGLFVSGGTMANFTALLAALRNTASYDMTARGLSGEAHGSRFRLYMSDHEGHVSIKRCADLLNLGRDAIRLVPSHEDFTINVEALAEMVDDDISRGDVPFCVIGQAGSINVGAIDPLDAIGAVCRERGVWFHVDGASGAVGAMLPEKRHLFRGMELADSVTLDPHKWLYIPYECGCVLVRNPEKLRRTFSMTAPYLRGTLPTENKGLDYLEYGPQMSRGFHALKVWMTMKHYGVEGYRKLLGQNVACARHLHDLVSASSDFEVLHDPTLFMYSFRYAPVQYGEQAESDPLLRTEIDEYLDVLNQRLADEIQASGIAFVMTSSVRGRTVLRFSICSHRTTPADIERTFEHLQRVARELDDRKPEPIRTA